MSLTTDIFVERQNQSINHKTSLITKTFRPPRVSNNKLVCIGMGFGLTLVISMITLLMCIDMARENSWLWIGFVFILSALVLLNLIYIRLIDTLFEKLNNRGFGLP